MYEKKFNSPNKSIEKEKKRKSQNNLEKQKRVRIFNMLNKKDMNEYKKSLEKNQTSGFTIFLLVFIPLLLVFELLKSIFTTKK